MSGGFHSDSKLRLYNLIGSYFTISMSEEIADYIIVLSDVCQVSQYSRGIFILPLCALMARYRENFNFCKGEISDLTTQNRGED